MATLKKRKIIWAVDAFLPEKDGHDHLLRTLRVMSEKLGATITPTYVLSPDQLNLSLDFTGPWIKQYKPAVEKSIRHIIEHSGLTNVTEPKIIVKDTPSLKNAAKSLSAFASSQGADLIVAGSQGRRGLSRLVVGSFAESLLMISKVPVLIVGPHAHALTDTQHILFPTDLGKASLASFLSLVDLAKDLRAKITLLHVIPNPIEPVIQSGVYLLGGGWVPVPMYLEKEIERHTKRAEEFAEKARKKGIEVSVKVDSTAKSVTQSVFDTAEAERTDWIAMAAESGPVSSALLGSIARQVVRNAPCPVWVLRSRAKKK
jgi:nucleotide-binding universal stress UspA family protein